MALILNLPLLAWNAKKYVQIQGRFWPEENY
jgi:hypothetical protein